MKKMIMISICALSSFAFSSYGSPKSITCRMEAYETVLSPNYLNSLAKRVCRSSSVSECQVPSILTNYSRVLVLQKETTYACDTQSGQPSTCVARGGEGTSAYFSYFVNSQRGLISLIDKVTGAENSSDWQNQRVAGGASPATATLVLKNLKGGLLGNPKIWQVEAFCRLNR